jgi:DNA excision repair protein ERCC-3
LQQWEARIKLHAPGIYNEFEFLTYQSMHKTRAKRKYSLVIYDEIQHMPANMGIKASQLDTATRIGLSATPWREDGNEDLIPALCGLPVGADWPSGEPAKTVVWMVARTEDKLRLVENLISHPTRSKTMIFVYRLEIGHRIAKALGVPFIHGGTANQYKAIQGANTFVISKVGDAGISIDVSRVIEVDWLGGRAEAGQRALRTQHADERGELHIIMTKGEYAQHEKRLAALYALNFDVRVLGA